MLLATLTVISWAKALTCMRHNVKSAMDMRGATLSTIAGGQWTKSKQVDMGYEVNPACPRCGAAREMLRHRVWDYEKTCTHEDYRAPDALIHRRSRVQMQSPPCG